MAVAAAEPRSEIPQTSLAAYVAVAAAQPRSEIPQILRIAFAHVFNVCFDGSAKLFDAPWGFQDASKSFGRLCEIDSNTCMLTWLCPLKPISLVTVSAHLPGSTAIACKLMDRETDGHT